MFEALETISTEASEPAPTFIRAGARVVEPPPPLVSKRFCCLLAEDNKTNQLVFRKMVSGFDIDLHFANNGVEAVEAFREHCPDLIFMDISMPQMDGKQATRAIREIEGDGPHVPIVAVTAHAMAGDREAILEAGLDDYLTKPLRKAELAQTLQFFMNETESQNPAFQASGGRTKTGLSGSDSLG